MPRIYLRTNSDLCHLQHKLIGFYNPDEMCLQRGTDWVFKYSGLRFVFRGLRYMLHNVFILFTKVRLLSFIKTGGTSLVFFLIFYVRGSVHRESMSITVQQNVTTSSSLVGQLLILIFFKQLNQ